MDRANRNSSAVFWVRHVVRAMTAEGLDMPALMRAAGIDPAVLDDPDGRVPSDKVSALWTLAVQRSGNPAIGLSAASKAGPGGFDLVGYAMMSVPDLRGVLERICRYVRIVSDVADMEVVETDGGVGVTLDLRVIALSVPWQRYAYDFMVLLTFCRWVLARDLRPAWFEMAAPAETDLFFHERMFGCPIRPLSTRYALFFSPADAALSLPTANSVLSQFHDSLVEEKMKRLGLSQIGVRVRDEIVRHLAEGEPRRPMIARLLGMSDRTLRRRLEDEGTSFGQLLDEARRDLAAHYVSRADLSLGEIAYLLGFNNQSSFFRAWKRWFDVPPRHFRTNLLKKCEIGIVR